MTSYVIIRRTATGDYLLAGTVQASSKAGAIRQSVRDSNESGEYAAIPFRHWDFRSTQISTETRVKIG